MSTVFPYQARTKRLSRIRGSLALVAEIYQALSDLYNIHLNIEAAQVGKRLVEEQLRQQRQQVSNSVKDSYYSLLQTQSALDAAEENLKSLHEIDVTTDEYLKEKTVLNSTRASFACVRS
jgi:outer membrane protein TolC